MEGLTEIVKKKRIRSVPLHVMVSKSEYMHIQDRMNKAGIRNMSAFIRKLPIDGYILHVDVNPLHELVSWQRRCINNLKQIAKMTTHTQSRLPHRKSNML